MVTIPPQCHSFTLTAKAFEPSSIFIYLFFKVKILKAFTKFRARHEQKLAEPCGLKRTTKMPGGSRPGCRKAETRETKSQLAPRRLINRYSTMTTPAWPVVPAN